MYNRYIRNDTGSYSRIPEEEAPPRQEASDVIARALRGLLDRLHLESVDTGDLLLLALLFLLYEEQADEELLFALGILLIL